MAAPGGGSGGFKLEARFAVAATSSGLGQLGWVTVDQFAVQLNVERHKFGLGGVGIQQLHTITHLINMKQVFLSHEKIIRSSCG